MDLKSFALGSVVRERWAPLPYTYVDTNYWYIKNNVLHLFPSEIPADADASGTVDLNGDQYPHPWDAYKGSVTKIVADNSNRGLRSMSSWFAEFTALTDISGLSNLDTTQTYRFDHMFRGCSSLQTTATFLGRFGSIPGQYDYGNMAYMYTRCSNLSYVHVCKNIGHIDEHMFSYCRGMQSITIPSSVKEIRDCAFGWSGLRSITIPNGVERIGLYAFVGCSSLDSIVIPESVKQINIDIYSPPASDPAPMRNVYYTSTVENWCKIDLSSHNSYDFRKFFGQVHDLYINGSLLTDLVIPSGIDSVYNFQRSTIRSVTLPSGVQAFDFSGCPYLSQVSLPDDLTAITSGGSGYGSFHSCTSIQSINLPNSLVAIDNSAFYECSNLANITIPNHVTTIGTNAFWHCTSLTSITIPDSVTHLGGAAFGSCSGLVTAVLPSNITVIASGLFGGCSSLPSIVIPNGVTDIGVGAFSFCSSLTSITIPNGVTHIGAEAFRGCSSFTSVSVPDTVTNIDYDAFDRCSNVANFYIGSGVVEIGRRAFNRCPSVSSYHFYSTSPPLMYEGDVFGGGVPAGCTIYVPAASLSAYQTASGWSDYASYMVGE